MKSVIFAAVLSLFAMNVFATTIPATKEEQPNTWSMVDAVKPVLGKTNYTKIFSVSGGDCAMNGSHVYLAVYASPQDGFKVFEIANVRNWTLNTNKKLNNANTVEINLTFDTMDADGNVKALKKSVVINMKQALTADTIEISGL